MPEKQEQELFDFVLSSDFPLYYQRTTTEYKGFAHTLMYRNEQNLPVNGTPNSDVYPYFEQILIKSCEQVGIKLNSIYRGSINSTVYSPDKYGQIHTDHDFPHNNFILYLDEFTDAPTYIFDKDNNVIKTSSVGKNKFIIFSGEPHAQGFCAPNERRTVVVFTFS